MTSSRHSPPSAAATAPDGATPPAAPATSGDSLLEFPCAFPIKVMGAHRGDFADQIVAVALQFDPAFDRATLESRVSARGNYLSVTCTVWVTSRPQLDDLYRALTAHPLVKVVL